MSDTSGRHLPFLFAIFFLLISIVSGCGEDPVQPQVQDNILGLWVLRSQTGSGTEVCKGELAQFTADGIAAFQCPGFDPVTTPYTAISDVLTFTETGLQYTIGKPADTTLVLTGINIEKTLTYGSQ